MIRPTMYGAIERSNAFSMRLTPFEPGVCSATASSIRRHGLLHVVELLFDEGRSFRRILETVWIAELLVHELLVFVGGVDLRERVRQLLHDFGRRSRANDDGTELRKRDLVAELVGCRDILEPIETFFTEQQDRTHLISVEKLRDIAGLLVKRVGV